MKKFESMPFVVSLSLISCAFAGVAHAADYTVDKDHSHVGFTVRHLVSRLPGEFRDFSGEFNFDAKKVQASHAKFAIQTASIFTNNEKRDNHLKTAADFFDVAKYPMITFESTKVTAAGKDKYKLAGNMTMHGVTRPAVFEVEYLGAAKDPKGQMRAGFTATTKLNRKDYGVTWNKTLDAGGVMVGDDVDVTLNIEAMEKASASAARK